MHVCVFNFFKSDRQINHISQTERRGTSTECKKEIENANSWGSAIECKKMSKTVA